MGSHRPQSQHQEPGGSNSKICAREEQLIPGSQSFVSEFVMEAVIDYVDLLELARKSTR
jgi:hypothetical protein